MGIVRARDDSCNNASRQCRGNRLRNGKHPSHQRLRAGGREPDDAAGLGNLVPGEAEDLLLALAMAEP